ncbi:hypothetical protein Tco_0567755 [Tanacetum coccineum]
MNRADLWRGRKIDDDGGVDDEGGVTVVLRVGGDGRGGVATVAAQVVRRLWVGRDGGDWVGVECEQVSGKTKELSGISFYIKLL